MLSLLVKKGSEFESLDLLPDTSIDISYTNHFFDAEEIVTTYSLPISLPGTTRNLTLLGLRADGLSNSVCLSLPSRVLQDGLNVISGSLVFESYSQSVISVVFEGSSLPDLLDKALDSFNLGQSAITLDSLTLSHGFDNGTDNSCRPLMCNDSYRADDDEGNNYQYINHMADGVSPYSEDNPVVPCVRLSYLLKLLYGIELKVGDIDVDNVVLLTNKRVRWALRPFFFSPVEAFFIDFNRFFDNTTAASFLIEILKLFGYAAYIKEDSIVVAKKSDIVSSVECIDWSNKFSDDFDVSIENPCTYNVVYDNYVEAPAIDNIKEVTLPLGMLLFVDIGIFGDDGFPYDSVCRVAAGDLYAIGIFDSHSDKVECKHLNTSTKVDVGNGLELSVKINPVNSHWSRPVKGSGLYDSTDLIPYSRPYITPSLPFDYDNDDVEFYLGVYHGKTMLDGGDYGYLSYNNYPLHSPSPNSNLPSLSLAHDVPDGLWQNHAAYAAWMAKPRVVLNGTVLLSPSEVANLNLLKKVAYKNKTFLIESIVVRLKNNENINCCDVVLIEV